VNLAALRTVKLLPAFLTRLIDKSCAIRMSGGQVSSCQCAYTRAPPFGVGDTRACFSYRIGKDPAHDPDIHSLRQCHAVLRPKTLVRGIEFVGHGQELSHMRRLELLTVCSFCACAWISPMNDDFAVHDLVRIL